MKALIIITIGIVALTLGLILLAYLNGYFTIKSNELIKENTYNISYFSHNTNQWINEGKKTKQVYKITYQNGRIKFKTKEFNH